MHFSLIIELRFNEKMERTALIGGKHETHN